MTEGYEYLAEGALEAIEKSYTPAESDEVERMRLRVLTEMEEEERKAARKLAALDRWFRGPSGVVKERR